MIARLPPNALARPPGFMMPRTVKTRSPSMVRIGIRLLIFNPFSSAKVLVTISESACARNTSGSSIASSRAFQIVIAQLAVAQHVHAEDQQIPLIAVETVASITGAAARTSGTFSTFSSTSSSNPGSPAET